MTVRGSTSAYGNLLQFINIFPSRLFNISNFGTLFGNTLSPGTTGSAFVSVQNGRNVPNSFDGNLGEVLDQAVPLSADILAAKWSAQVDPKTGNIEVGLVDSTGNFLKGTGKLIIRSGDFQRVLGISDVDVVQDALSSIALLENSMVSRKHLFRELLSFGQDVTITAEPNPNRLRGSLLESGKGLIRFDFRSGLEVKSGVQSPAVSFAHEAGHVLQGFILGGPKSRALRLQTTGGNSRSSGRRNNRFESTVIDNIEKPFAKALGQPYRSFQGEGSPIGVSCATCTM